MWMSKNDFYLHDVKDIILSSTTGLFLCLVACKWSWDISMWILEFCSCFFLPCCWDNPILIILNSVRDFWFVERSKMSFQIILLSYHSPWWCFSWRAIKSQSFSSLWFSLFAPGILELWETEDITQAVQSGTRWPLVLTASWKKHRGLGVACVICIMIF